MNFKEKRLVKFKGFTLIELLVSMFVIALLSSLLLPNFMGARERARDASKKQDLDSTRNALRIYYNDHQAYPTGTVLDDSFSDYMPGIVDVDYEYVYEQTDDGDGFRVSFETEATKAGENGASQLKCGVGAGDTDPDIFMICGN